MSIVNSVREPGFQPANTTSVRDKLQTAAVRPVTADQPLVDILQEVAAKIAPVWPLQDYVAVNPFLGLVELDFLDARRVLQGVADAELLMPWEYFSHRFQQGWFDKRDVIAAIDELLADGVRGVEAIDLNQLLADLRMSTERSQLDAERSHVIQDDGTIGRRRSILEQIDEQLGTRWSNTVMDELGKYCGDYFDRGQALWTNPWRHQNLFAAWRSSVVYDRSLEVLGIRGFRQLMDSLPLTAEQAIEGLLHAIGLPRDQWAQQLWCEALAMPGWSAWSRYRARAAEEQGQTSTDFQDLLAIRLAYSVSIGRHLGCTVRMLEGADVGSGLDAVPHEPTLQRYLLQKACELAMRRRLLHAISANGRSSTSTNIADAASRPAAQLVFCIDVRSERMRRHLELASPGVETFGFAGFFGMPIEFVPFGEQRGASQVPVLIQPKFQVHESCGCSSSHCPAEGSGKSQSLLEHRARESHFLRGWKAFQASAVTMFGFVETAGLLYGYKLFKRMASGWWVGSSEAETAERDVQLKPGLGGLEEQGIALEQRVALAEAALRGIGLTEHFARLVVLCGHGSQTENNPLKAGLDCGACGGHSGEANARFAVQLLNDASVRTGLHSRGVSLPADTCFVAALHNTTTDRITFFADQPLPESHREELESLLQLCQLASESTGGERIASLTGATNNRDLSRRSNDWSEVRPEWGLAGNAAFIAAPRHLTRGVALEGRTFLHSYDHQQDPAGSVLEVIMTAPLVVAHWINMQYYASVVDPSRFGSGSKTIHNVVGQFGLFAGNGGDLLTGLPWQSVHDGDNYQHHPLRLQAWIAAPRAALKNVIDKHTLLQQLLLNDWLQLIAIEDADTYRFNRHGEWEVVRQHIYDRNPQ